MSHSFSQTVVLSALIVSVAQLSVRAEVEKHVRLLHISDTHAQLETHPEYMPGEREELQMMGGYARLKTATDVERKGATGAVFLVDGGDTFQGSGPAAWSRGQVVVNPLNALGLDAFVPGNWEPVYGAARFRELMLQLKAPVICYNFHDEKSGQRLFPPMGCERAGEPLDVVCRKRNTHDVKILPFTIHEALLGTLKKHPVIASKRDHRSQAVDLSESVFSQDAVLAGSTRIDTAPTRNDPFRDSDPARSHPETEK